MYDGIKKKFKKIIKRNLREEEKTQNSCRRGVIRYVIAARTDEAIRIVQGNSLDYHNVFILNRHVEYNGSRNYNLC